MVPHDIGKQRDQYAFMNRQEFRYDPGII